MHVFQTVYRHPSSRGSSLPHSLHLDASSSGEPALMWDALGVALFVNDVVCYASLTMNRDAVIGFAKVIGARRTKGHSPRTQIQIQTDHIGTFVYREKRHLLKVALELDPQTWRPHEG